MSEADTPCAEKIFPQSATINAADLSGDSTVLSGVREDSSVHARKQGIDVQLCLSIDLGLESGTAIMTLHSDKARELADQLEDAADRVDQR